MALPVHSLTQTMSRSSTYTAYARGVGPGSFQVRQRLAGVAAAGLCIDRLPLFHSLTQMRPRLSLHTRRAPCFGVGGSTTVDSPVFRSLRAMKLTASEHHQTSPAGTYAVQAKRTLTPATLGAATAQMRHAAKMTGLPGLLVTDCFSTPMAEKLRVQKQPFADAAGNAYLEGPGLLVYVTGRKLQDKPVAATVGRAFANAGLKVQFALICNPALTEAPQRAIVAAAGVALGVIPAVLADLQPAGHLLVQGKKRRLNATKRFLYAWALDYARRLRPKTLQATYVTPGFDAWEHWEIDPAKALWGGEPAARLLVQHLRPGVLTLYAVKMPVRLLMDCSTFLCGLNWHCMPAWWPMSRRWRLRWAKPSSSRALLLATCICCTATASTCSAKPKTSTSAWPFLIGPPLSR